MATWLTQNVEFADIGGWATYGRVQWRTPTNGYARLYAGAAIKQLVQIRSDAQTQYITLLPYVAQCPATIEVSINGVVVIPSTRSNTQIPVAEYIGQTILLSIKANSDGDYATLTGIEYSTLTNLVKMTMIPGSTPFIFSFVDTSISALKGTTYLWDFGDGQTSTESGPSHEYASPGEYVVTMTTDKGSTSLLVHVDPLPPYPGFTQNKSVALVNEAISFTNSSWNATSYSWDFGDGQTSTVAAPSHSYASKGTYTVTLTATNAYGQTSKTTQISIAAKPITNFSASPVNGLTVQFSDLSLEDPTSWSWDFGENEHTLQNPVHSYQQPGTYNVTLTATNAMGSTPVTKSIPVTVSEPVRPEANFSYQPTESNKTQIEFTDTSSNAPSSWLWSFGDGTTSTEQNPVHQYSTGGVYSVRLTVTNANGDATVSKTISVITPGTTPPTSGTVTPSTTQVGTMTEFTVTGTGFKPNVRIRIVHNSFRGVVSKFKSVSSSRIVFSYAFDPWFVGVNSIAISNPDGSSVVIPDCIRVRFGQPPVA